MMRKALLLGTILFVSCCPCFAGEKEELQLQQLVYQERLGRLQAEFILAQIQQKEVNIKLETLTKKEKENAEKVSTGVSK